MQFSIFWKVQSQQSLSKPLFHCGLCQENHPTDQCPQLAEVNAIRNFQRNQGNPNWQPLQQQGQNQGQSSWSSNQGQWNQNQGNSNWRVSQVDNSNGNNRVHNKVGRIHPCINSGNQMSMTLEGLHRDSSKLYQRPMFLSWSTNPRTKMMPILRKSNK